MRRKRSPVGRRGVVCLHASRLSLPAASAIPSTALARDTRERGQWLAVTNVGAEVHSFTEVVSFGAGIVPPLNAALPPGTRDAKPVPGDQHFLLQGQGLDLTLSPGRHLFQCLIHPWRRSLVDQRQ